MTDIVAFPFLRPTENAIQPGAWRRITEDSVEVLYDVVNNWDYSTNLDLERVLRIDPSSLLTNCQLKESEGMVTFIISVELTTGDQGVRRSVLKQKMTISYQDSELEHRIHLHLPGHELQGYIKLTTGIAFIDGDTNSRLSPTQPGSRLWEDQFTSQLEGGGGRLPMESSDFNTFDPRMGNAPWIIHMESIDPEVSFLGHIKVSINTRRADIMEAVRKGEALILERLAIDLVKHLLPRVVDLENFTGNSQDYEHGSIGKVVAIWVETAFEGQSLEDIRSMKLHSPSSFEALLSSRLGGINVS